MVPRIALFETRDGSKTVIVSVNLADAGERVSGAVLVFRGVGLWAGGAVEKTVALSQN